MKKGLLLVVYKVKGEKLYYLPELLHRKGVNVYDFSKISDIEYLVTLDFLDLSKFFAICKNMCYNKKVVKYKGILSPAVKVVKNLGFMIGCALFLLLSPLFSDFVLKIEVEGSGSCFSQETITVAMENGAKLYSRFSKLDYGALETAILTENPRLSFVTAEKVGNKLVINAVLAEKEPETLGCREEDLVCEFDGVIEEITVLRGTALVESGAQVKKGDKLVGAYLTLKDGSIENTYVLARVKILQNYKYFYKCDAVTDLEVSVAYALSKFNLSGEVINSSHRQVDGGIEITSTVRRIVYGGN